MAEINDLNVTDASNDARMPEGQAPSTVNNGVRALEGLLARGFKDALEGDKASTGSANVFAVAANRTISAYYDGLTLTFEATTANTSTATLNVDAVGAKAIVWPDGTALRSGDIPAEAKVTVRYDLGNTRWLLCTVSVAPSVTEEGTWTPVATFATAGDLSVVYSTQVGNYIKIGNMVTVQFFIITSTFTHTTASGNFNITGLPFASENITSQDFVGALRWTATKANYTDIVVRISPNVSLLTFGASGSGQATASVGSGDMPSAANLNLIGTITYRAA